MYHSKTLPAPDLTKTLFVVALFLKWELLAVGAGVVFETIPFKSAIIEASKAGFITAVSVFLPIATLDCSEILTICWLVESMVFVALKKLVCSRVKNRLNVLGASCTGRGINLGFGKNPCYTQQKKPNHSRPQNPPYCYSLP